MRWLLVLVALAHSLAEDPPSAACIVISEPRENSIFFDDESVPIIVSQNCEAADRPLHLETRMSFKHPVWDKADQIPTQSHLGLEGGQEGEYHLMAKVFDASDVNKTKPLFAHYRRFSLANGFKSFFNRLRQTLLDGKHFDWDTYATEGLVGAINRPLGGHGVQAY